MNDQIKQIAQRIRELREILDVDAADLAKQVNVSVAEYNQYENAESDHSDRSDLRGSGGAERRPHGAPDRGRPPHERLHHRAPGAGRVGGAVQGLQIQFSRLQLYRPASSTRWWSIWSRWKIPPELVVHGGQEFNYVLKGTVQLVIGSREFLLEAGDSAFFNPMTPHGQRAVGGPVKFLTIINE